VRPKDQIPDDYTRPKCPYCHRTMSFVVEKPHGERYACQPCEFGIGRGYDAAHAPMTNFEASWIIRHGITTPASRKATP
jgi:hypothetical protein